MRTPITVCHYGIAVPVSDAPRQRARRELGIPTDALVIGSVGRLRREKGYRHLLKAFASVHARHKNALLVIIGEGPERLALQRETGELNLEPNVRLVGARHNASELIAAFDVFVLPSLYEGFGLVLLEAMSRARAIVASDLPAIREVVADECAILVEPANEHGLSRAILELIEVPERRRRLERAGLDRVKDRFTLSAMARCTEAAYREVLNY